MRLRTKILFSAAANLVLLGPAVAVFVRLQFRPGVESIHLAMGEARIRELADQIEAELLALYRLLRSAGFSTLRVNVCC